MLTISWHPATSAPKRLLLTAVTAALAPDGIGHPPVGGIGSEDSKE